MRITSYNLHLSKEDRLPMLVKEASVNYSALENLNSADKITLMMNDIMHASDLAEEYVWLLALNTRCKPIGLFEISHGTYNQSPIDEKEILTRLLLAGATLGILIHNHPSGDVTPSKEDKEATASLVEAGKIVRIQFADHIIIGDGYYSFAENHQL